jgi:predicted PurR-regulated permease PerM
MIRKIEISHRTVIFTVFFLIFLWLVFYIKDIILTLFAAGLIMIILNPLVTRLTKWKIPRVLSVIISYILVLGVFGGAIGLIIPPLIEQSSNFAANLPLYLQNLGIGDQIVNNLLSQLGSLPGQVVKIGVSIVSNILVVFSVLIFAFYFLLYRSKLDSVLGSFLDDVKKNKVTRILDEIEIKLGGWTRGELTLMFTVGTLIYLGLTLLGIPYALPLAILAGLLEIVPMLGPTIAAVPAVIIGLSISPVMGLAAAALAFLVQQLENYILVPKIMEKSVGVSPIVTLIALTIGFRLLGIAGALMSVPVVILIKIILKENLQDKS